jgi:hypothetical protein
MIVGKKISNKKQWYPCIHLEIYKMFKEKAQGRNYLDYSTIREILRRRFHEIRRPLHYVFLKEMEEIGLIKRNGNTKNIRYELTGKDIYKLLNKYSLPV